jgi:hypothetical protein
MQGHKKMKIYTFATGRYLNLAAEYLIPSMKDDVYIKIITKNEEVLPGQTKNLIYRQRMLDRVKKNFEIMQKSKGEKILFLDCDCVVLDYFVDHLSELLEDADYMFQSRGGTIDGFNGGLQAVKVTDATMEFFKRLIKILETSPIEDDLFPEGYFKILLSTMTKSGELNAQGLPPEYGFLNKNTKIYHAINGGISIIEKELIFKTILGQKGLIERPAGLPLEFKLGGGALPLDFEQVLLGHEEGGIISHGIVASYGFNNLKLRPTRYSFDRLVGEDAAWSEYLHELITGPAKKIYHRADDNEGWIDVRALLPLSRPDLDRRIYGPLDSMRFVSHEMNIADLLDSGQFPTHSVKNINYHWVWSSNAFTAHTKEIFKAPHPWAATYDGNSGHETMLSDLFTFETSLLGYFTL